MSVGPVLDSYDAKIDEETGELMVKGPSVMKGYYNNPEKTAEVLEADGWLHTGDIGEFDSDGRLYITGRIKNMIVLSGGKKYSQKKWKLFWKAIQILLKFAYLEQ